ncbi:SH3-like domain-containing protein [Aquabacter spiritensis]|uniref:Nitrile hydratase n=1 Tax=Aquabacter spiritensis TaxID=933073 RepID=A0A4R3LVW7_9HYPH|nr:SH3-like domain-containing protein [Aquabacter spiritensis]TCT04751.1 nitrile hydratase [Aquabacter spiritensis]
MSAEPARYACGAPVRIRDLDKPGHVRTPFYVRNKTGVIEQVCGDFENPEERAYGRVGGARIPLYRVRFLQRDLWEDYAGPPQDTLVIEIYSHWLQPASGTGDVP